MTDKITFDMLRSWPLDSDVQKYLEKENRIFCNKLVSIVKSGYRKHTAFALAGMISTGILGYIIGDVSNRASIQNSSQAVCTRPEIIQIPKVQSPADKLNFK